MTSFSYHRAVAPMMWVLVALASIELVVVHLLIALLWSGAAAAVLSAATLAGIGWLVACIASMKRLPVLIDDRSVLMRAGTLKAVRVPLAAIADGDRAPTNGRAVLNLALIAHPNVVLALREPLPGRRGIMAVAHRLDDPDAFHRVLGAARQAAVTAPDRRTPDAASP